MCQFFLLKVYVDKLNEKIHKQKSCFYCICIYVCPQNIGDFSENICSVFISF